MVMFQIINAILLGILLVFGIVFVLMAIKVSKRHEKFQEKRDNFEWYFDKLLLSYRIHILKTDIKKEGITIEELNNIAEEALFGKKASKKHVLDEMKEEVRGEMKKAKEEVKKTSSK